MPAVHTEALTERGETCRWMSAAARASGDRVLASLYNIFICHARSKQNGSAPGKFAGLLVLHVHTALFNQTY